MTVYPHKSDLILGHFYSLRLKIANLSEGGSAFNFKCGGKRENLRWWTRQTEPFSGLVTPNIYFDLYVTCLSSLCNFALTAKQYKYNQRLWMHQISRSSSYHSVSLLCFFLIYLFSFSYFFFSLSLFVLLSAFFLLDLKY